jgi:hypothetical protein
MVQCWRSPCPTTLAQCCWILLRTLSSSCSCAGNSHYENAHQNSYWTKRKRFKYHDFRISSMHLDSQLPDKELTRGQQQQCCTCDCHASNPRIKRRRRRNSKSRTPKNFLHKVQLQDIISVDNNGSCSTQTMSTNLCKTKSSGEKKRFVEIH